MIGVGWTLDGVNFLGGSLRMLFPFSLGMLLSRKFKPFQMKGAFWICSIVLLILFCVPYIKVDTAPISLNGLFEAACIILIFPILVWLGASGKTTDKRSTQICKFLGDISYPLYAVHYPIMYLFYAWLIDNELYTFAEIWPMAIMVYAGQYRLGLPLPKTLRRTGKKVVRQKVLEKKINSLRVSNIGILRHPRPVMSI